jgi:hypothetical protein
VNPLNSNSKSALEQAEAAARSLGLEGLGRVETESAKALRAFEATQRDRRARRSPGRARTFDNPSVHARLADVVTAALT